MKWKKKHRDALKKTAMITILLCSLFVGISLLSYEKPSTAEQPAISEDVENYRPIVEDYADQYDVGKYVDVILAMMMQESGGRGNDPMQASESYCGERECIKDPMLSIKQGIYYFSKNLDAADGDLELAVQSYNYGSGFIDYVREQSGSYSQETAIAFSQEMYQNVPNQSDYRCIREESEELDACYGDIYYLQSVMEYRDVLGAKGTE